MIGGQPTNTKDMLKISIAGVITNIIYAVTFLAITLIAVPTDSLFYVAFALLAYINAFMALFNLIPFGILDGFKIFVLNKKIWAAAFTICVILIVAVIAAFPFIIF